MRNLKQKIKKWFYDTFLKRYLAGVNDSFVDYFTFNYQRSYSIRDAEAKKRYNRIIKELSSSKYKKYFYTAVNYTRPNSDRVNPYSKNIIDVFKSFIAKTFIFFYDRKLYNSIKLFKKWTSKIIETDNAIDDYFANTNLFERNDRRLQYGLITKTNHDAIVRLGKN